MGYKYKSSNRKRNKKINFTTVNVSLKNLKKVQKISMDALNIIKYIIPIDIILTYELYSEIKT